MPLYLRYIVEAMEGSRHHGNTNPTWAHVFTLTEELDVADAASLEYLEKHKWTVLHGEPPTPMELEQLPNVPRLRLSAGEPFYCELRQHDPSATLERAPWLAG